MLGPEHIAFCADNYGGRLGDACLADRRFPICAQLGCFLRYEEHKSNRVLFLSLVRNLSNEKVKKILKDLPLTENKIDGICFVETPEKYRIT